MALKSQKIVLGADHAGFRLKERIAAFLTEQGISFVDVGCVDENSVDYPDISARMARTFQSVQAQDDEVRGLLCCGSGIGICMAANRFPWIRAVEAHDYLTAVMSRRHNDANTLCLGGRVVAPELAFELISAWLATPFDGGRHQHRVDLMSHLHIDSQGAEESSASKEISPC